MATSQIFPRFPQSTTFSHSELQRVNQYFEENQIKQSGNKHLYWKQPYYC